ncbi:hypothetical protein I5U67_21065 [Stenotrophomonas maltophilia]|uniref:Biotin protein ligase C-terminal domain-containing protein n=1 Tax=Stenotrophomonas maltophilia TaxID=40324 RepID=A0A6B8IYB6_STEMA|nr:hypothetical protein [Stenotrophomonas maltophilia]MBH1654648.1 hypothetical protein [Stenotrophomonas maltophilia]MDT3468125.1 hypothetical protein [Stenotrophomonas maltophilia]QGL99488.1 hypothetical protein FEO89_01445 [Stenotrophomonas maltophilia]HDS1125346.1 hypothetical protein [Stenotrophomonas maltophilia]HDS1509595.1 hypothetical protein [Stenotrophomonas maltophilia]
MTSKFLREHADALSKFAKETADRAQSTPEDFFLRIAAKNQEDAARAVTHQLMLEAAEDAGELVDLRLLGPKANGSISLDWFIRAMDPLSKAWKFAAHRLRYGSDAARGAGADVVSALNLKLAGIGQGSTRIFVTGNGMPDLTGESLLQATLTQIFLLLNARQDEFYDAVDAVGGRSAHQLGEFMKELDQGGFAAQFAWQSPRGRQFWEGRPDEIVRIRMLLDTIREPDRYQETITGRVAGITDTGRLELRTDDGKVVVRFPLKLTEQVQRLTITSLATIQVQTARYWDSVQKKDIYKRQLMEVQ